MDIKVLVNIIFHTDVFIVTDMRKIKISDAKINLTMKLSFFFSFQYIEFINIQNSKFAYVCYISFLRMCDILNYTFIKIDLLFHTHT